MRYPTYTDLKHPIFNGNWGKTIEQDPQQFLIANNYGNNLRVLVFASKQHLPTLDESQTLYINKKFDIASPDFTQFHILAVELESNAVTAVFALLQRTQEVYTYLLNAVADSCVADGVNYP